MSVLASFIVPSGKMLPTTCQWRGEEIEWKGLHSPCRPTFHRGEYFLPGNLIGTRWFFTSRVNVKVRLHRFFFTFFLLTWDYQLSIWHIVFIYKKLFKQTLWLFIRNFFFVLITNLNLSPQLYTQNIKIIETFISRIAKISVIWPGKTSHPTLKK